MKRTVTCTGVAMHARGSLLLLLLMSVGCSKGPPLGSVSGTVTWKQKPLAGATVTFTPSDGQAAFARTAEDGSYELKFSDGRSGAVLGENAVSIETYRVALDEEGDPVEYPEVLPPEFHVESTLVRNVEPGAQVIDFDLSQEMSAE